LDVSSGTSQRVGIPTIWEQWWSKRLMLELRHFPHAERRVCWKVVDPVQALAARRQEDRRADWEQRQALRMARGRAHAHTVVAVMAGEEVEVERATGQSGLASSEHVISSESAASVSPPVLDVDERGTTARRAFSSQGSMPLLSSTPILGTHSEDDCSDGEDVTSRGTTLKWSSDEQSHLRLLHWRAPQLYRFDWLLRRHQTVRCGLRASSVDPQSWRRSGWAARRGGEMSGVPLVTARERWFGIGRDVSRGFTETVAFWRSQGWFRPRRPRWIWRARWARWSTMHAEIRRTTREMARRAPEGRAYMRQLEAQVDAEMEMEMDGLI
jgi:hypothetical protein